MNYDLIIARYGEVGLKSHKVRSRFEKRLIRNMESSIEAEIDIDQARIFIFPQNFDDAINKLSKILG